MMNKKLKVGDLGKDVSKLQDMLKTQGLEVSPEERQRQFFGPSTRSAVGNFQKQQGIDPTCEACEETIASLGQMADRGTPNVPISGAVPTTTPASSTISSPAVPKAIDPPADGTISVGSTPSSGSTNGGDGTRGGDYKIFGRVIGPELRGLRGLQVVAVDKNIGREVTIGKNISRERGAYEIHYSALSLKKQKPDVQTKVIGENGEILAASTVRYNASRVERGLDIRISAEKLPLSSEYRRLVDELGVHLGNHDKPQLKKRLATLKEDNEQQDITYLANKTGWDARMVAMTALANQFGERNGIEPEFYYALFQAGVPASESALSQIPPEMVGQTWKRAIEQKILPTEAEGKISKALEKFTSHSIDRLLEEPARIGVSNLKDRIGSMLKDPARQRRFAQLYYEKKDNLEHFWEGVRAEFPNEANRLQLDGKLSFLTINNAPLIQRIHTQKHDLQSPLDLIRLGLYERKAWGGLLKDNIPIPKEVPGETPDEQRANYADFMASQLHLSYPTAVVAERIRAGMTPLPVENRTKTVITEFLDSQQDKFELGIHPVERYLNKNKLTLEPIALGGIKKLQRVYQISPSDEAMDTLLKHNLDSSQAVIRYSEQSFVQTFAKELGGISNAKLIYSKAHQVHHAVLNVVTAYLLENSAPSLYAINQISEIKGNENGEKRIPILLPVETSGDQGNQLPKINVAESNKEKRHISQSGDSSDILAYPTLEGIFGEMDYCACEHCRSWLSPAAYLVDLLQFLDPPDNVKEIPLKVLLSRRPDIQHIQLTCENTNTVLPYIDLVNEILEHYVVHNSMDTFAGYNVETGMSTEDLLATPQFVNDATYTELRSQVFPPPLPFHQPLESLRRYFDHFEVPLHEAMERLRQNDDLERSGGSGEPAYGWRDVLMERLRLSRAEYEALTDSSIPLQRLFGEDPANVTIEKLINHLTSIKIPDRATPWAIGISNAKFLSRRLNLTYEELIEITRTQFFNAGAHLIPKLEKLHINFKAIQSFLDGMLSEVEFSSLIPIDDLDITAYGGNAEQSTEEGLAHLKEWLHNNKEQIMGLIVLSDPTGSEDVCSFETIELRYALPDFLKNTLRPAEYLKLLRFIRLWHKLGWSIEQTDKAIAALYPADKRPIPTDDYDTARGKLDAGFQSLIVRLAHLQTVMQKLKLKPKRDLTALLACWSTIDTYGDHSLYRQMFLNKSIQMLDDVFREDGYGNYLDDSDQKVMAHSEALRAAFNLSNEEFDLILEENGFDDNTVLNLDTVSAILRHGYMARKLRLSVTEFLQLKAMSGLNPFLPLDMEQSPNPAQPFGDVRPEAIRFIELAQRIKASPFKVSQLVYFLQHVDLSGNASPSQASVLAFARTLRVDLLRVEREHVIEADPGGEIARAKMALVYGVETTDIFFGLLTNTSLFQVPYTHDQPDLEADILAVVDRLTYDHFQKQLSFKGVMTAAEKTALESAVSATGALRTAVQALFDEAEKTFAGFFDRYSDLKELYENFATSSAPVEEKISTLLADFLPDLRTRLKRQQIRLAISAQVGADLTLVTPFLETASLLHTNNDPTNSAISDFLALETEGLSADIFFSGDIIGDPDLADLPVNIIEYRDGKETLPLDPANKSALISGIWHGFLEAPDNGFYNFYVETDVGAELILTLDGEAVTLVLNDGLWENQDVINLETGRLYELKLIVKKIRDVLILNWERKGMGRMPIPAGQLYPATSATTFSTTYLRLLKGFAIADTLALSRNELKHFAAHTDYRIDGEGWLNALPAMPVSASENTRALLRNVLAIVQYNSLKERMKVRDESLLSLLQDPLVKGDDGEPLLGRVTGWRETDLVALLNHSGLTTENLGHLNHFGRLFDAFYVIKKFGINAATLTTNTTNEPAAATMRTLQATVRARYDQSAWLKVIQPINDELRRLQRDSMVAFVLHRLKQNEMTRHIDTPDKLFEYFLIDVQMDPCMKTSRIKQAISSVQLFVQRCLLNLEPQVASRSIKAQQWKWMKRYRVWEANRKVFLWPENWLEPELRDNKSPFFKDLESELLQSDITDDAAATALVHYLEKLDEVAKLEICGMYYEENEENYKANDVVHVVARTAGARRTYYYRRQDGGTAWTAWEKIDLNIEDNPVLPVVWQGRLFLFWVTVLQQPVETSTSAENGGNTKVTDANLSQLKGVTGVPETRVAVTLNWSEFYHGKWQPLRTSDVNRPFGLGQFVQEAFNRGRLGLRSVGSVDNSDQQKKELRIEIEYEGNHLHSILFYNKHSLPVVDKGDPIDESSPPRARVFHVGLSTLLKIEYQDLSVADFPYNRTVLGSVQNSHIVEIKHPIQNIFEGPFFFQDLQHVFYVTSEAIEIRVREYTDFGIWTPQQQILPISPAEVQPDFPWLPKEFSFGEDVVNPGIMNSGQINNVLNKNPNIHRTLGTIGTISYGDRVIGANGSVPFNRIKQ